MTLAALALVSAGALALAPHAQHDAHAQARRRARPVAPRVLHPHGDPQFGCVEMYSQCGPAPGGGPQRCTSAQYQVACGQTRPSPHARDRTPLRCDCP